MPALDGASRGVPGSKALRALEIYPSLWAILADVPLDRYGPTNLEPHLHDINWVADIGVRHEAVIERAAAGRGATVLPMKLFTMFSSADRVRDDLRRRRRDITTVLRRVRGCQEWGVRVTRQASEPPRRATAAPTTGAAFLAAKKRARDEVHDRLLESSHAAEAALASLSAHARAAIRRKPPRGALTPPLVDAALLVPSASRARFRSAVARAAAACRDAGAVLSVSGPWPPYNFVSGNDAE